LYFSQAVPLRDYRAYLDELLGELYEASNGNAIQLSGRCNRVTGS
jgi:hypothetical protein